MLLLWLLVMQRATQQTIVQNIIWQSMTRISKQQIGVLMCTSCPDSVGDNKITAEAICRMIGVFDHNESLQEHSFTGREFSGMSEAKQEALLRSKDNLVFSRAEPRHKQVRSRA